MDIQKIRDYFPQLKNVLYFNTGTSGPLPLPVINEIKRFLHMAELEGHASSLLWNEKMSLNLRKKTADFLKVKEEEICFTQSTSHGLGIIFAGIDWKKDDEILVVYPEYISGMLNCQNVEKRYGVNLRIVETDKYCRISEENIIKEINENTRLILLSHIAFHNGQRVDVKKIIKAAERKDILTLVDGAQTAGAIELKIKEINPDFYVLPVQKWLLGEEGLGVLYIKDISIDKIKSSMMGYESVESFSPDEGFTFHKGAQRFEMATIGHATYFAFSAALDFYRMIGEETIFSRIERLTDYLKKKLSDEGIKVITPMEYKNSGGLVSFMIEGINNEETVKELYEKKKIIIRSISIPKCLRASVHYFNTEDEIDRLVEALRNYL